MGTTKVKINISLEESFEVALLISSGLEYLITSGVNIRSSLAANSTNSSIKNIINVANVVGHSLVLYDIHSDIFIKKKDVDYILEYKGFRKRAQPYLLLDHLCACNCYNVLLKVSKCKTCTNLRANSEDLAPENQDRFSRYKTCSDRINVINLPHSYR